MDKKFKIYSILLLVAIGTLLVGLYNIKFSKYISFFISLTLVGILAFKFISLQVCLRISNYLEEPIDNYNSKTEKYRFLVQIIFFPIAIFSMIQLTKITTLNFSYFQLLSLIISNLLISLCILIISFTWTKKFSLNLQNPSKNKKELRSQEQESHNDRDFYLSLSESELNSFYENIIHHDIITCLVEDNDKNDNDLFLNIFFQGKIPENPTFKLNLDHIQSKLFFEELKKFEVSGKKKFTLKIFSQIFTNKNGIIVPKNLSSSNSKADSLPKNNDLIISLFEFDKKVNITNLKG